MAREADDMNKRLAGQVPCRWRSRSSEGLGLTGLKHWVGLAICEKLAATKVL